MTRLLNKPAPSKNNGNRLASKRNNDNKKSKDQKLSKSRKSKIEKQKNVYVQKTKSKNPCPIGAMEERNFLTSDTKTDFRF